MPDDVHPSTEHEGEQDKAAQAARAKRLREQIAQLKGKAGSPAPPATSDRPESPRDFIDRKMREADEDQER
jgi:hypothetical protein